jgi:hypothetical protein
VPRTTLGLPHLPDDQLERNVDCLCAGCHKPLLAGQWVRQQALYKRSTLDSIPIGHAECCPDFDNADAAPSGSDYTGPVAPGDRLRWPGSGPADHIALGHAYPDNREGSPLGYIVRAQSSGGRYLDVALPANATINGRPLTEVEP